jgi:hypothetical protein
MYITSSKGRINADELVAITPNYKYNIITFTFKNSTRAIIWKYEVNQNEFIKEWTALNELMDLRYTSINIDVYLKGKEKNENI